MKQHIATKKAVIKIEWISSKAVIVTYADFKKETMTRKQFEQLIR